MVELWGKRTYYEQVYVGGNVETIHTETLVAIFDTKNMAREYINKSKLKNPVDTYFKKRSLLSEYDHAEIKPRTEPEYIPTNPTL